MAIEARLELGEREKTEYIDPNTGETVVVEFEHPTPGQWAKAQRDGGLTFDKDGQPVGLDTVTEMAIASEDIAVALAKACIKSPDPSTVNHVALIKIGEYLNRQATLRLTEGEPSGPSASGPTSEPSETPETPATSAA